MFSCMSMLSVVAAVAFVVWGHLDDLHDHHDDLADLSNMEEFHGLHAPVVDFRRNVREITKLIVALEKGLPSGERESTLVRARELFNKADSEERIICDRVVEEYDALAHKTHELREQMKTNEQLGLADHLPRHKEKFIKLARQSALLLHDAETEFAKLVSVRRVCDRVKVVLEMNEMRLATLEHEDERSTDL